jgi:16S rRNA U516 pseudouridylate synthase RsuA-like enzyme
MSRLLIFNKPFNVLCQFSAEGERETLKDYIDVPAVYPAGRLDTDSEGLLLLTDDGRLQARIADPKHKAPKTYLAQVEGVPDAAALDALRTGVDLGDFGRHRRGWWTSPTGCGPAIRPSANARRSRPRGSSWCCAKARTGRCDA